MIRSVGRQQAEWKGRGRGGRFNLQTFQSTRKNESGNIAQLWHN